MLRALALADAFAITETSSVLSTNFSAFADIDASMLVDMEKRSIPKKRTTARQAAKHRGRGGSGNDGRPRRWEAGRPSPATKGASDCEGSNRNSGAATKARRPVPRYVIDDAGTRHWVH